MIKNASLGTFLLLLGTVPGMAGPRDDTFAGIFRCSAIQDDRMLLDCIYGAAQPLRHELGLTPAPDSQIRLVPPAAIAPKAAPLASLSSPPRNDSFFHRLLGEDPINEARAPMASYSFDRRGLFTLTLDNGEIWGQLASDPSRAHWRWPARDHTVSVQGDVAEAALQVNGEAGTFKVQRLH